MIKIPLTQRKFAIVDNEFSHLKQWKWYAKKNRNTWYAVHAVRKPGGKQRQCFMHWLIIGRSINKSLITDHINGDGLDNRRANLRNVTFRENGSNTFDQRMRKTSSKFVGVSWNKHSNKWQAEITIGDKHIYLGKFINEKDASDAYQEAVALLPAKTRDK